jgi:hypothetical protein
MEPITSEQELKTLLDEGKITQEEYQELLAAMKDKPRPNGGSSVPENKANPKKGIGRAALILFILSIVLPLFCLCSFLHFGVGTGSGRLSKLVFLLMLFGSPLCGLLAFIFGIIAWKTVAGKIAALGIPILVVCIIPLVLIVTFVGYRFSSVEHPIAAQPTIVFKEFTCDSLDSLIVGSAGSPVEKGIFSEDNGAIKIQVLKPDTFHLYETGPLGNANNTMLFYTAKVRTEALNGRAYLELWCSIPGKGEFFSRGLDQPFSGTQNWITQQISFRNDTGINPDNIKLNLVVEGTGTIWIDDIQVTGGPL